MKPVDYGDHAVLVRLSTTHEVMGLAAALGADQPDGILDVVPAERTVLVTFDPTRTGATDVRAWVTAAEHVAATAPADTALVEIPVVYDGADLDEVARRSGLGDPATVVARHTAPEYVVAFTGFAPGFGYLVGGDPALALPRRDSPRTRVPTGAVAVAGGYSGVYPRASPGGWWLLGRTGEPLWDADRTPAALLTPGTRVRFVAVETQPAPVAAATDQLVAEDQRRAPSIDVLAPGPLTTVQDLGRAGQAWLGVPTSGAADRATARLANRLVGNAEGAAVLEITLGGLRLRALRAVTLALTGADCPATVVTGEGPADLAMDIAANTPITLAAGAVLDLGAARRGVRCYLAMRGGVGVAPVLGSRSADLLAGLGPRALRARDRLATGDDALGPPVVDVAPVPPPPPPVYAIRPGPGLDLLAPEALDELGAATWRVGPDSNRVAVRLTGPPLRRAASRETPSEGLVRGAIQIPPGGEPVLFLVDHPVTGGYPVVAVVADADLDRTGQLRPGDEVRFTVAPATTLTQLHGER